MTVRMKLADASLRGVSWRNTRRIDTASQRIDFGHARLHNGVSVRGPVSSMIRNIPDVGNEEVAMSHSQTEAGIVSGTVALGQTLNLQIVAEGVETAAQQRFLTRLGCDSLQGFLRGRPMSGDDFILAIDALNDVF
jgi:hypothetical protein